MVPFPFQSEESAMTIYYNPALLLPNTTANAELVLAAAVSLLGHPKSGVRAKAQHRLLDLFEDGGANEAALLALLQCKNDWPDKVHGRFAALIRPRIVELADRFGWRMEVRDDSLVVVGGGKSFTFYTGEKHALSRAEQEARTKANRAVRHAAQPKPGQPGQTSDSHGKKGKKGK